MPLRIPPKRVLKLPADLPQADLAFRAAGLKRRGWNDSRIAAELRLTRRQVRLARIFRKVIAQQASALERIG